MIHSVLDDEDGELIRHRGPGQPGGHSGVARINFRNLATGLRLRQPRRHRGPAVAGDTFVYLSGHGLMSTMPMAQRLLL